MAQLSNNNNIFFEIWGSCFFNAKNTDHEKISNDQVDDLLNHFSNKSAELLNNWGNNVFESFEIIENGNSKSYIKQIKTVKYIRFPKCRVTFQDKHFILAFRVNICSSLNIIKIFYYLQSENSFSREIILTISTSVKPRMANICNNIEETILADSFIGELFSNKLRKEVFDLRICNVNTANENLEKKIFSLINSFDKSLVKDNKQVQKTLLFLYSLNEEKEIYSLEELRNEVILNYSDNQFTTTQVKDLKGFYIYYVDDKSADERAKIFYLGIAPYKDLDSMHALNRKIAISYATNT